MALLVFIVSAFHGAAMIPLWMEWEDALRGGLIDPKSRSSAATAGLRRQPRRHPHVHLDDDRLRRVTGAPLPGPLLADALGERST
jgi:hypothetical protein